MVAKPAASERVAALLATIESDLATLRRVQSRRETLRARVESYEARFGIPSDEIHAAIDDGRLVESDEVCDWIIAHDVLQRSAT